MLFLFLLHESRTLTPSSTNWSYSMGLPYEVSSMQIGFWFCNVIFLKQDLSPIVTFNFCCCQFNRCSSLIILGFAYMSSASLFPEAEYDKEGYEVTILATVHAKGSCYMNLCCCQFNRCSSLIILGFAYTCSASLFPEAECDKEGYRLPLVLEVTILVTSCKRQLLYELLRKLVRGMQRFWQ